MSPSVVSPKYREGERLPVPVFWGGGAGTYGLAEDHVAAVLQAQVGGYGGRAVLHEQEDHCLLGLVAHHGHAVGERGQQGVKGLTPFT